MKEVGVDNMQEVVSVLQAGGVVIFPTETSYGLGCDATNDVAVAKIFAVKGRPEEKGTPVLVASVAQAKELVQLNDKATTLANTHWPGALNIVAPIQENSVIARQCGEGGFQAVRVSSHPVAQQLVEAFGGPIVATSANISGEGPLFDATLAQGMFSDRRVKPDLVLNAGQLDETPASTIVKVEGDEISVLRQGEIQL